MSAGLKECTHRELVTSHTAFGYLAEAYDLDQKGITGLTPESEPSAKAMAEVVAHIKEHGVSTIYTEPLAPSAVAKTVATEASVKVATLDPLEGITDQSAAQDYLFCLERVYPLADYITINISSPNTAGLRELQEEQALRQLIGTLRDAQEDLAAQHGVDAGQQLARIEGFRQIVVGPHFQSDDAVDLVALGGEHDNRHGGFLADLAADVDAVHPRQHEVEQDEVRVE